MNNILVIPKDKSQDPIQKGGAPYDGIVLKDPFFFPITTPQETAVILHNVKMAHDLLRTGGMLMIHQDNPSDYEFAILSYFSNYSILVDGIIAIKTRNTCYIDIASVNDNGMEWPSVN
jgi:hypothetical protein